jgi:glycosyltransferase involved in cell wall biosynthesis
MRILIITDKQGTAIDRLARSVQRNLLHHQIIVLPVHPKRNDVNDLYDVVNFMKWADVIDVHYWKSGQLLRTTFAEEFSAKPKVLFHFNPYDINTEENQYYDLVVVGNEEIHNRVPFAHLVPYCIDLSFFKYNPEYTEEERVMMSVNRIEGKKGVLEVAKACKDLGYIFTLVGRVSKPDYMRQVISEAGDKFEFYEDATDEKLREIYYKSAIHVCNSIDSYESGTLPILEAMACGVPVLTRKIGHVPDLFNGSNMVVRVGAQEDVDDLKVQLKKLMQAKVLRTSIREKAWETVKNRDDRRMALDIQKLYYKLFKPNKQLVSIIIPTRDNPDAFSESLIGAIGQDYDNCEIVVADSGDQPIKPIVDEARKLTAFPIKYIHFDAKGTYSLAEARNRAVIESDGKILVFCDARMKMLPNAVSLFVSFYRPQAWLWGSKDGVIKGFVENFSCIGRDDFVRHGMFNERMQWYGGMTQELRSRFEGKNNFEFIFLQEAQAVSVKRATSKNKRREDIINAKFLVYKLHSK